MLPAAPELSSAAFYIAAGNYRKKTKRGLNWQEMEMNAPKFEHTAKPMPKSGFDGKRTAPNRFNKK